MKSRDRTNIKQRCGGARRLRLPQVEEVSHGIIHHLGEMTETCKKADRKVKVARFEEPSPKRVSFQETPGPSASRVKGKEKADEDPPHRASKFSVVAGSYERLLYGLEGTVTPTETGYDFNLEPMFMFPAHVSCIKAVAASPGGKWLATGSADEIVKVWDLARRKEIGGLMHHQGMYLCSFAHERVAFTSSSRVHYISTIPVALASTFCIGGRHAVSFPRPGLDGVACIQGSQRAGELCSSAPVG